MNVVFTGSFKGLGFCRVLKSPYSRDDKRLRAFLVRCVKSFQAQGVTNTVFALVDTKEGN